MSLLRASWAMLLVAAFSLSAQEYRGRVQGIGDRTPAKRRLPARRHPCQRKHGESSAHPSDQRDADDYLFDLVPPPAPTRSPSRSTGFSRFVRRTSRCSREPMSP